MGPGAESRDGVGRAESRDGLVGPSPASSCRCPPPDSTVKAMVTEMSIGEEDFQQLQAQEGVAITFCLKEFRVRFLPRAHRPVHPSSLPCLHALLLPSQGLLSFAESANLSLSIHFDAPGR